MTIRSAIRDNIRAAIRPLLGNLWSPANIASSVWYDASDASTITESSGKVSEWADKSGNGEDATQGTGSLQPTISGNRIVFVNGGSVNLGSSFTYDWTGLDFSVFIVADYDAATGFSGVMSNRFGAGAANWWTLGKDNSNTITIEPTGGGQEPDYNYDPRGTGAQLYSFNKPSLLVEGFLNGVSVGTGSHSNMGGVTNDLKLGTWLSPGQGWDGGVNEILILPNSPNVEERQKIEGYLAWKWGIMSNLEAEHPYKNSPPTV